MTEAPIWQPSPERIQNARITHYHNWLQTQDHQPGDTWQSLHQWSINNPEAFWESIWQYFDVRGQYLARRLLENGDRMPGATWFGGARLNVAENLLRGEPDRVALIEQREDGRGRQMTYGELREHSARLAGTFQEYGIGRGDRVAAFITNGLEAVIGMLATARLGAVWSTCSPDFGYQGVLERFGQIQPKALIAVNGYQYNGRIIDTRERVQHLEDALPELTLRIRINNQADCPWEAAESATDWHDALQSEPAAGFTPVNFGDPLYILYSSGTTGAPKCIVHSAGGTLLQHLKELGLHTDVRQDDVVFYYTTTGWMMWNWLVSTLALGATAVLYDGSPMAPTPEVLWNLAEEHGITVFGASAKYYAACEKSSLKPRESHGLEPLKAILSTGSPLAHESFDYLYRDVKPDVCLSSISGGTDIVSCFALGNPTLPVYRGELQCLGLGMDVAIYNEAGEPVTEEKGELVCRTPFPAMPLGFWNDPDGKRFQEAYFSRFEGTWAQGDFGAIHTHPATDSVPAQRGMIIHGRADAVLNPGGVRIGTAEIYRQVEKLPEVMESIAVGQQWGDDQRVVLFVRLNQAEELSDELRERIRTTLRENTTPRHVPARILQVPDIPRTLSGKIVELAVRQILHGETVRNREALANPEALAWFEARPELSD